MAEGTKLEVEGGELLIKSSKGIMAVIPKAKASYVKKLIEDKNYKAVDEFVSGLKPLKRNPKETKAEDGVMIKPKRNTTVIKEDVISMAEPGIAKMNYIIAQRIAAKDAIYKNQKNEK